MTLGSLLSRLALIGALSSCAALAAQARQEDARVTAELGPKWEASYRSSITTTATQRAARIPRGAMTQTVTRTVSIGLRVVDERDEYALLEVRYDALAFTLEFPLLELDESYDSSDPPARGEESDLARAVEPLVGIRFKVAVNRAGEILEVLLPEQVVPAGQLGGVVQPLIDEVSIREELAPIFSLGDGPGEQWQTTSKTDLDLGIEVQVDRTFSIEEAEAQRRLVIGIGGDMRVQRDPDAQLARANVQDSSLAGQAIWNLRSQRLDSYRERSHIRLVIEPTPGNVYRLESETVRTLTQEE